MVSSGSRDLCMSRSVAMISICRKFHLQCQRIRRLETDDTVF